MKHLTACIKAAPPLPRQCGGEGIAMLTQKDIDRFWSKPDRSGKCWLWPSKRDRYCTFNIVTPAGKKSLLAHRVAYELANGPIPSGQYVCHRCDNPRCVRPDHLFLGTQTDNMQDMARKGRGSKLSGEQVGSAVLTWELVHAIRLAYQNNEGGCNVLSKRFGISSATLQSVVRNRYWHDPDYLYDGPRYHSGRLTWEDACTIRARHACGETGRAIAKDYGVGESTVSRILRGEAWTEPDNRVPSRVGR